MSLDLTDRSSLKRYAWLSIAAALVTIGLKTVAWLLAGSVGLLSETMESGVNLVGAMMALAMLTVAARPADDDHAYGHSKAEYFSSGVEGSMILLAAVGIGIAAARRLFAPRPIEQIGVGLLVSAAAAVVNLVVAMVLLRKSKAAHSITLDANAQHLLTDVWTSAGVIVGVGAVGLTGWLVLDPLLAIGVAANIVWTGVRIVRDSVSGLMDAALPASDLTAVRAVIARHEASGVQFHALRTRQSGARRFVSLHVLVPGTWSVHDGHRYLERFEAEVRAVVPNCVVDTHLESLDDPASWQDEGLDRKD